VRSGRYARPQNPADARDATPRLVVRDWQIEFTRHLETGLACGFVIGVAVAFVGRSAWAAIRREPRAPREAPACLLLLRRRAVPIEPGKCARRPTLLALDRVPHGGTHRGRRPPSTSSSGCRLTTSRGPGRGAQKSSSCPQRLSPNALVCPCKRRIEAIGGSRCEGCTHFGLGSCNSSSGAFCPARRALTCVERARAALQTS
jgi:hypothetical protein